MFFDSVFKAATVNNIRVAGLYLHYFIEGAKQLQDYHGSLFHVISNYREGDFTVGKELITSCPISCTENNQTVMSQINKHKTNYVLKFVNVPAKIMPMPESIKTFNEAVVLPGCKVKVTGMSTVDGTNFIELVPAGEATWSDEHLFRAAKVTAQTN